MSDLYVRPRGCLRRDTSKPHNPNKKQSRLEKNLGRLLRRQTGFSPLSSGGHECHKPGSMKK